MICPALLITSCVFALVLYLPGFLVSTVLVNSWFCSPAVNYLNTGHIGQDSPNLSTDSSLVYKYSPPSLPATFFPGSSLDWMPLSCLPQCLNEIHQVIKSIIPLSFWYLLLLPHSGLLIVTLVFTIKCINLESTLKYWLPGHFDKYIK